MDYPNIFALGQDAFTNAYAQSQKQRQDRTKVLAGRAIAQNDFTGAQQAYGQGGMPDQAVQALDQGQQQQNRAATIQAATAYGNGDTEGAVKALGPTGDLKNIQVIQQEAIQKHQTQMKFAQEEATKLRQVYASTKSVDTLLQAFDAQIPQYKQMGTTDQEIAQLRQAIQQNPDATLQAVAAPRRIEYKTVGNSLYAIDADTGQQIGQPLLGSKYEKLGPTDKLYDVTGGGSGGAVPGAPSGGQPAAGFDAIYSGFVAPHEGGYTAHDGNGAPANFGINQKANPDVNVQNLKPEDAKQILKDRYWTPSGADSLPPALQAIQFDTAVNMGVGAAKQLLQQSGGDPAKYLQLREQRYRAIAAANPAKASSLPNWLQRNQDLGQFVAGQQGPQGAPQQGGPRLVAQGDMAGVADAVNANPNLHGADYLATLPASMQGTVKAIAEGRMAAPTGAALRSPQTMMILDAVSQYDPTFSAANAATRVATRKDFTSGKSAQTLTAFNTALAHLSNLDAAISGLNNTGFPLNNSAAHWIAGATGTDARLARFEAVKRTALDEVNKALVGGGGALGDREALMNNLKSSSSPETLHAALNEIADLLEGKIHAMGQQYTQGMGTDAVPIQLITPAAQLTLNRLRGLKTAGGGGQQALAPGDAALLAKYGGH